MPSLNPYYFIRLYGMLDYYGFEENTEIREGLQSMVHLDERKLNYPKPGKFINTFQYGQNKFAN
jgi:hypothetical protein